MVFLCIVLSSHEAYKIDAEFEWNLESTLKIVRQV